MERDDFVQNAEVACGLDILRCGVWQPEAVIGYSRANTFPQWRKPPMLHIPLDELPFRGAQQMFSGNLWHRDAECHDILELITKSVCAAGLVKRGACPYPAGERLIEQPTVHHHVHCAIRRFDLDCA